MENSGEDCFDAITRTEEALTRQSYEEGVQQGQIRGCRAGYELGYVEGLHLGKELAEYFSTAVAHLQLAHHDEKLRAALLRLIEAIREFPFANDPTIIERRDKIRILHRLLRSAGTGLKQQESAGGRDDEKLSF